MGFICSFLFGYEMHIREPGSLQKSHSLRKDRLGIGWFLFSKARANHADEDAYGLSRGLSSASLIGYPYGQGPGQ